MIKNMRRQQGFTFIELLVSVGIMLLLAGTSITVFTRFRERRVTENEAKMIRELIQATQRKALAGEKPQSCLLLTLEAYEVRITAVNRLEAWAICSGGDAMIGEVDLAISELTAPAVGSEISFGVARGGVTPATVSVCGAGYAYDIEVGSAGSISAPIDAGSC